MAAINALIERDGQGANAAAETDAAITHLPLQPGIKAYERGNGNPQIIDAAANDVIVFPVDIIENMEGRVGRDRRAGAQRKPAKTGKQHGCFFHRHVEIRSLATAITMAHNEAATHLPLARQQHPPADTKTAGGGVGHIEDMPAGVAEPALAQYRSRIRGERAAMALFPEIIEARRRLGRGDGQQLFTLHAIGRVEIKRMGLGNAHAMLVS
ncbi:hypothetical protein D3C86_1309990 [compost metagenome]